MNKFKPPTKILIVDDHQMVRDGLMLRLSTQQDLTICGEGSTEEEALALAKETSPHLVIVDISLKNGNGIDIIKQLKSQCPNVKTLVFSAHAESLYAERAMRAGAMGYVNKQESNSVLLKAIRSVLSGQRYVSAEVTKRLVNQALGNVDESKSPIDRLTDRELEVFRMIGEGLSSSVIAKRLFLSSHTIDSHRENIKRKLGVMSAGELTRAAVQWRLEVG